MAKYTIDLSSVSIGEFRALSKSSMSDSSTDEILARASGMALEAVQALPYNEYRQLLRAFFRAGSEPLADPN